jgi:transcriptional regulator with XRE-family HTH domain
MSIMNTKNLQQETIGKRISIARENAKLSKSQITDIMCLSRSICGKWEKGISSPSTQHLVKLAEVLQVSFDWLATGKEVEKDLDKIVDENTQNIKITQIVKRLNKQQKSKLLGFLESVV